MIKATLLVLCILAVAYSIDESCINTGNFGFLPEVVTDCLTGSGGAMSLSIFYQITLAGSGNATVTGELDYDTVNLYQIVPLTITNFNGDATIAVSEGYTLNPCRYPKLSEVDPTLIVNELFATDMDISENSTLSYLVYNRLQTANITFDTAVSGTTPSFNAIAEYFVFEFDSDNSDDMYNITITLQNTVASNPSPFLSLEVAGAGNCVETYPAAKSLGLTWVEGNATASFTASAGAWNIGIFTAASNTPYSIVISKQYLGTGDCDEFGFCQEKSSSEDQGYKIALIVVSVFFGVFVIGAVAAFLYSRRKRADYRAI